MLTKKSSKWFVESKKIVLILELDFDIDFIFRISQFGGLNY